MKSRPNATRVPRCSASKIRTFLCCIAVLSLAAVGGCAGWTDQRGVLNKWRDDSLPALVKEQTTLSEVLERFGPPSQVIGLSDRIIFYYMLETTKGRGLFLMLYNTRSEKISYDRAIFFFDEKQILTDYAFSSESAPYEHGD